MMDVQPQRVSGRVTLCGAGPQVGALKTLHTETLKTHSRTPQTVQLCSLQYIPDHMQGGESQ